MTECFVCLGNEPPLLTGLCACTDRAIHLACQRAWGMNVPQGDAFYFEHAPPVLPEGATTFGDATPPRPPRPPRPVRAPQPAPPARTSELRRLIGSGEEALRAMREHRLAVGVIIRTVRDSVEALRTGQFVPESATETEDGYRSMRDAFRMLLPWPRGEDVEGQVRGVTLRRGVLIAVGERAFELLRKDAVSGSWVCVGVDPVGPERLLRLSGRGASTWRLY